MARLGRTTSVELDHGGPLVLWDAREGPRTGLRVRTAFCETPSCPEAHVEVAAVEKTDAADGGNGLPRTRLAGPKMDVAVDVASGETRVERSAAGDPQRAHLADRFRALLADKERGLLEVLQKRWRHAKGITRDEWRRLDWSEWEPGGIVTWQEVFPDDPNLLFSSDDETLWANDGYCIASGCACRDVVVSFHRLRDTPTEEVDAITVDLERWKIRGVGGEEEATRRQVRLWSDLQRGAPHVREELAKRREALRRIAPEIHALAGHPPATPPLVTRRPGRNDPCPCGSGRKFKKCCLA